MNAVMLMLRGCPAGWLGAYGNEWVGTPNLDAVAAEGVVFDRHISDCPDPSAALRAWFTGRHEYPRMDGEQPVASPSPGLLEYLKSAGVHTVLVRANRPENNAPASFYDGWVEVFDTRPSGEDASPLDAMLRELPAMLGRVGGFSRWFLAIDIDRLLPPWDVPQEVFEAYIEDLDEEEETDGETEESGSVTPILDPPTGPFDRSDIAAWEWLHRTFAALVTTFDAELGDLFRQLRSQDLDKTAMWLLSSDYGYPLGEHGQVGRYRPWLHEELIHLPLILRLPGAAEAGRHVTALTQPADLYATLVESFTLAADAGAQGRSLLTLARGEAHKIRDAACSGLELNGAAEWSIRTPEWALLLPGNLPEGESRLPLLFEKPDDRWEVNDLYSRQIDKAEDLEAALRATVGAIQ